MLDETYRAGSKDETAGIGTFTPSHKIACWLGNVLFAASPKHSVPQPLGESLCYGVKLQICTDLLPADEDSFREARYGKSLLACPPSWEEQTRNHALIL